MATSIGKPAINDPRGRQWNNDQLRDLQQIIDNIRKRFAAAESALAALQASTAGVTANTAGDLTALKKRVTNLEQALAALQAEVDALDLSGGSGDTDPRIEQMAGELMGLQAQVDGLGNDPGRLPQVEAAVATLQRQVDDIDTVGQTATHAALLQRLTDRIDDLDRGVLI